MFMNHCIFHCSSCRFSLCLSVMFIKISSCKNSIWEYLYTATAQKTHASHGRLGPAAHLLGPVLCLPDVSRLETQLAWSHRGNKRPLVQRGQQYQLEAGSQTAMPVPGTGGCNSLKLQNPFYVAGHNKKRVPTRTVLCFPEWFLSKTSMHHVAYPPVWVVKLT